MAGETLDQAQEPGVLDASGAATAVPGPPPPPASAEPDLGPTDAELLEALGHRDTDGLIPRLQQEIDVADDARRRARLGSAVADLREGEAEKEAMRLRAQALTEDPSLASNGWALGRYFRSRGQWENLVRLIDAEIRFGSFPRLEDRADLLIERGRLLEDRLERGAEAAESYRAALDACPGHVPGMLALLMAAFRGGRKDDAERALTGLLAAVDVPETKALLAVELSRVVRGPLFPTANPDDVRKSADVLFRALTTGGPAEVILDELDRVSLVAGVPTVRDRILDAYDSRLTREGSVSADGRHGAVALYREKARTLLRRGSKEAALAVIERGRKLVPDHPLLIADLLDLAEDAGKPDALAEVAATAGDAQVPHVIESVQLRRAELLARTGAAAQAQAVLDGAAGIGLSGPMALLAGIARARMLIGLGDTEGLASFWAQEARRIAAVATAESIAEGAHLLVRAATLRLEYLNDSAGAELLLREVLALVPGDRFAVEVLSAVLVKAERWLELAELLQADPELKVDSSRGRAVRSTLRALCLDVLKDPGRARLWHESISPPPTWAADAPTLANRIDGLGREYVSGHAVSAPDEARKELAEAWLELARKVPASRVQAALRVAAARALAPLGSEASRVTALLSEATRQDPTSSAGAFLETRGAASAPLLREELASAESRGAGDLARALRFRLAFLAAEAGAEEEAMGHLAPLRSAGDALAQGWSFELARQSGDPRLELAALRDMEPADQQLEGAAAAAGLTPLPSAGVLPLPERVLLTAEALESLGDSGASAAFAEAHVLGPERPGSVVDAALGTFRLAVRGGDIRAVAGAATQVAEGIPGWPAQAGLKRAADVVALMAGDPVSPAPSSDTAEAALRTWFSGVTAGDEISAQGGLSLLRDLGSAEGAKVDVATELALRQLFRSLAAHEDPDGTALIDVLSPAAALSGGSPEARAAAVIAATDLGTGFLADSWLNERQTGISSGNGDLQLRLDIEKAQLAERQGRLRSAVAVYAQISARHPTDLEALEGLRRVARAVGDKAREAAVLARLGRLLYDPGRAAARLAEAALLYEELDRPVQAAQQFLKLLEVVPTDEEAHRRLKTILERRDDVSGIERLLGFKLAHTTAVRARAALYSERAELRLHRLSRRKEGIEDLRRALSLDPASPQTLRRLAVLASEERRYAVAVELLGRAQKHVPEDEPGLNQEIALELAVAYEYAGQPELALSCLRATISAFPAHALPRERLIALALRRRDLEAARGQFDELESLAEDVEAKSALKIRRGRMEIDFGAADDDAPLAQRAFVEAIEMSPLGEGAAALLGMEASLPAELLTRLEVVFQSHRMALAADPLNTRVLTVFRDLAQLTERRTVRAGAAQLLSFVGQGHERGRTREIMRPIAAGELLRFGPSGEVARLALEREIWAIVGAGMARVEELDAARFGGTRQNRVPPRSDQRLAWIESTAAALGVGQLTIYIAGADELAVIAFSDSDPCLVLGRGVVGGDPSSRFLVGRALFLLAMRATAFVRFSPEAGRSLWQAISVAADQVDKKNVPEATRVVAKALSKGLSRRESKALEALGPRLTKAVPDGEGWQRLVVATGNRFGLALAGDMGAALRGLIGAASEGIAEVVRRRLDCLDLVAFGLSDAHVEMRRQVGLEDDSASADGPGEGRSV